MAKATDQFGVIRTKGTLNLVCLPCLETEAAGKEPYGDVHYCDPGYQKDGKKRYPVNTESRARAAWSYVNQKENAGKYSPGDLAKVKGCIKRALKHFGVETSE